MYGGSASGLQERRFEVLQLKRAITTSGDEEQDPQLAEFLGKVIEGLRNEALQVAMGLSDDELTHPRKKTQNPRQPNEPMTSNITRRQRWIEPIQVT